MNLLSLVVAFFLGFPIDALIKNMLQILTVGVLACILLSCALYHLASYAEDWRLNPKGNTGITVMTIPVYFTPISITSVLYYFRYTLKYSNPLLLLGIKRSPILRLVHRQRITPSVWSNRLEVRHVPKRNNWLDAAKLCHFNADIIRGSTVGFTQSGSVSTDPAILRFGLLLV